MSRAPLCACSFVEQLQCSIDTTTIIGVPSSSPERRVHRRAHRSPSECIPRLSDRSAEVAATSGDKAERFSKAFFSLAQVGEQVPKTTFLDVEPARRCGITDLSMSGATTKFVH